MGVESTTTTLRLMAVAAGDRIHLQQVLLNLKLNGLEAMSATPTQLFEPFYTTKGSACGTNRGGNNDEGGATFTFLLKASKEPHESAKRFC